ncbi:hypothetical protein ON010_g8601 [Phytophthora cinnamomi]|nr:hypothetical protein ON010_g8601 [Phytophthora cinnamomi]
MAAVSPLAAHGPPVCDLQRLRSGSAAAARAGRSHVAGECRDAQLFIHRQAVVHYAAHVRLALCIPRVRDGRRRLGPATAAHGGAHHALGLQTHVQLLAQGRLQAQRGGLPLGRAAAVHALDAVRGAEPRLHRWIPARGAHVTGVSFVRRVLPSPRRAERGGRHRDGWTFYLKKYELIAQKKPLTGDYKAGFNRSGLFRYSRHPNFFGEMSLWINAVHGVYHGVKVPTVQGIPAACVDASPLVPVDHGFFESRGIEMLDGFQDNNEGDGEFLARVRAVVNKREKFAPQWVGLRTGTSRAIMSRNPHTFSWIRGQKSGTSKPSPSNFFHDKVAANFNTMSNFDTRDDGNIDGEFGEEEKKGHALNLKFFNAGGSSRFESQYYANLAQ